jgi:hypothetical protein
MFAGMGEADGRGAVRGGRRSKVRNTGGTGLRRGKRRGSERAKPAVVYRRLACGS